VGPLDEEPSIMNVPDVSELSVLDQLRVRAATDDDLRARLAADPAAVLRAEGVEIGDAPIRVIQVPVDPHPDTAHLPVVEGEQVLMLPYVKTDGELSDADLEAAAGGLSKLRESNWMPLFMFAACMPTTAYLLVTDITD
jgi:hypothetical protein